MNQHKQFQYQQEIKTQLISINKCQQLSVQNNNLNNLKYKSKNQNNKINKNKKQKKHKKIDKNSSSYKRLKSQKKNIKNKLLLKNQIQQINFYNKKHQRIVYPSININKTKNEQNKIILQQQKSIQKQNNQFIVKQPGFNQLFRHQFLSKTKQITIILNDQFYQNGKQWTNKDKHQQYKFQAFTSIRQPINPNQIQFSQNKINIDYFKIYSLNMNFPSQNNLKGLIKNYSNSTLQNRVKDVIDNIKKALDNGFHFIFLQQLVNENARNMFKKQLQSGNIKCYYPTDYFNHKKHTNSHYRSKHLIRNLRKSSQQLSSQQSYKTLILSKLPVKFGELQIKIDTPYTKSQNTFCQFIIEINGQHKIVRMISAHLKADKNITFFGVTKPIYHQKQRAKQIQMISEFSESCDILFVVGDTNIGQTSDYQKDNQNLNKNFVDILQLDDNLCKLKEDDGSKYGTYMWNQGGELSVLRLDRCLIRVKDEQLSLTKKRFSGHVQVECPLLSIYRGKQLKREQIYERFTEQKSYITISDHFVLKSAVGLFD